MEKIGERVPGVPGWRVPSRPCDYCKRPGAEAAVFCQADSAFLCHGCDDDIHGANNLASRHERVLLSQLSKPDPFPFSRRHDLLPPPPPLSLLLPTMANDADVAAIPNPIDVQFFDPCFDFDFGNSDGLVPFHAKPDPDPVDFPFEKCLDVDFGKSPKLGHFGFSAHSFTQTVSSSSQDFGVVPDGPDMSNPYIGSLSHEPSQINIKATQLTGVDREARVLRYKEKRKNRKFEKTIRYASRKAYAETRPRIKSRFAKRSTEAVKGQLVNTTYGAFPSVFFADADFGIVPSF